MATIASLVTQLIARDVNFTDTFNKAESRFAKFQKSLVGKTIGGAAIVSTLTRAFHGLAEAAGNLDAKPLDAMQQALGGVLRGVPFVDDLSTVFERLGRELDGTMHAYRRMMAEHDEFMSRMAKFEARAKTAEKVIAIYANLENQIKSFGRSAQIAMAMAAGATDAHIAKIQLLESHLRILQDTQKNLDLVSELEQAVNLFGVSEAAIERYKAAMRGATGDQLAYMESLQDTIAALKMQAELQKDTDELLKSLRESIATFGMSAAQIEIWRLAQRGAAEDALATARALDEQLEALKKQKDLMEEGKRIYEQTRTAAEKYAMELEKLRELLAAGAIDEDTFRRAVEQAEQELKRANAAAGKLKSASEFQSPAAIEKRFGTGMPTGIAAQDKQPLLELKKKTDLVYFDGRIRTGYSREIRDGIRELNEKFDFTVVGGLN